jgi:ABC-2 type transport system ATP-binding protein
MIEVAHLTKSYGPVQAVRDVSFRVERGEVVGFLGPNGAGKSTTLRILAGFLGQTSGRVRIAGHDIGEEPLAARASIGYMPETAPLYPEMRVREYLTFRAELKGIARGKRREAVAQALADARVTDMADVLIGNLSKGYRQRVALADALVASPPLLILDEPTAGLDPNQIREVRALIGRLGETHTVLLSTHILSEVEATCTRAVVISGGQLVAEGSIDDIRAMRRHSGLTLRVRGDASRALATVRKVAGVGSADLEEEPAAPRREGGSKGKAARAETARISIDLGDGEDADLVAEAVAAALVGAGIGVREIAPRQASLEQVFSELTETATERAP